MDTDRFLGFSAIGFQSAVIAFARREAAGSILVRLDGRAFRGHEAPKCFLAQRAKLSSCRCCVAPSLVAVPANCAVGEVGAFKVQGSSLWTRFGTWAERRLAAAHYVKTYGELSTGWDGSVGNLTTHTPPVNS